MRIKLTKKQWLKANVSKPSVGLKEIIKELPEEKFSRLTRLFTYRKANKRAKTFHPEGQALAIIYALNKTSKDMKGKKRSYNSTPRLDQMTHELMQAKGYPTLTAVIQNSIIRYYEKTFPNNTASFKTPESPADKKQKAKGIRQAEIDRERDDIIEAIGGTLTPQGTIKYYTYSFRDRFEQELPQLHLQESIIKTQYHPSREKVEQLQQAGECPYFTPDTPQDTVAEEEEETDNDDYLLENPDQPEEHEE